MRSLIFVYSYGMGGWGDMIKGLHTTWCWAKATNRTLIIDFSYHILGDIFPQHRHSSPTTTLTFSAIDKVGKVNVDTVREFDHLEEVTLCCNWFSVESIGSVDPLPFYEEVYTTIFPLPEPLPERPYHVLHCRLGDKYLTEALACKSDNRIGSFGRLKGILDDYNSQAYSKSLVCSDSASALQKLLASVPNSFTLCPNPYHFAYLNRDTQSHLQDIRNTILEHRAMTYAESITMISYSGFPITAAMFRNIPLKIWRGETKEPYIDDMVAPLRALRKN